MESIDNLPAVTTDTKADPKVTNLFRALKLASEFSSKTLFTCYGVDKFKFVLPKEEYELDCLYKDLVFAEAHLDQAQKAFAIAKREIQRIQGERFLAEF